METVLTYRIADALSVATSLLLIPATEDDFSSLRFLTTSALTVRRKEETKRETKRQETQQSAADAMERTRLLLERNKRKRKKRRLRQGHKGGWQNRRGFHSQTTCHLCYN